MCMYMYKHAYIQRCKVKKICIYIYIFLHIYTYICSFTFLFFIISFMARKHHMALRAIFTYLGIVNQQWWTGGAKENVSAFVPG